MIRIHQTRGRGDDAVAVRVRIIAEGDFIFVFQPNELGHRVRARTIHADLAVVIDGHERKPRIDQRIYNADVELVVVCDARPVSNARAA